MGTSSFMLLTGLVKQGVSFFFTTKAEKRKARVDNLKEILLVIKGEKKVRSVFGWVLTVVVLVAIFYDIVQNGGDNFESLMLLFAAVSGA